ncbi:hypothetical protein AY599_24565 [Leptolyngbya valderiana BDU 20041]|nr:hypothetical protein AY599_24565 [Leptolyngbya valderiana BDU 20041]
MKRWTPSTLASALLPALLALSSLGLAAVPTADPGPDSAQINGSPGSPNRDVFAVEFTAIDGDNISPRDVLWLEPGSYEITVRVDEAFTVSPAWHIRRPQTQDDYVSFELTLEAGKRYDIRGQYNRNNRNRPYNIIVDRVETLATP